MDNDKYNSKDIKNICEKKLKIEFEKGKRSPHEKGWFHVNGQKAARISVSYGKKFITRNVYSKMASAFYLEVSEFDDLLACPLSKDDFTNLVVERNSHLQLSRNINNR